MSKSRIVDVVCQIRIERDLAIAVTTGEIETVNGRERERLVWLPRSVIEIEPDGDKFIVSMPEWLAKEKELI